MTVQISSWEGLWCRFQGDDPDTRALREWSPTYRREAWRLALADQGVDDIGLAEELGEQFTVERRTRHEAFPDVEPALRELRDSHALALVTNGASCLQREKLTASGLRDYFDVVVVSAEFGVSKPNASIFHHALSQLQSDPARAVMVGDNLSRDVDGAIAAGLQAVWLNRLDRPLLQTRPDVVQISTLGDLITTLNRLP